MQRHSKVLNHHAQIFRRQVFATRHHFWAEEFPEIVFILNVFGEVVDGLDEVDVIEVVVIVEEIGKDLIVEFLILFEVVRIEAR